MKVVVKPKAYPQIRLLPILQQVNLILLLEGEKRLAEWTSMIKSELVMVREVGHAVRKELKAGKERNIKEIVVIQARIEIEKIRRIKEINVKGVGRIRQ